MFIFLFRAKEKKSITVVLEEIFKAYFPSSLFRKSRIIENCNAYLIVISVSLPSSDMPFTLVLSLFASVLGLFGIEF